MRALWVCMIVFVRHLQCRCLACNGWLDVDEQGSQQREEASDRVVSGWVAAACHVLPAVKDWTSSTCKDTSESQRYY